MMKNSDTRGMSFVEKNDRQRMDFVEFWGDYVATHDDKDWSRQQNMLINSCLRGANMTKEHFLDMKKAGRAARD